MGKRLRFGIIGLSMGAGQAQDVAALSDMAEVAAVTDLDTSRCDAVSGRLPWEIRSFTDYREMLKMDDLDAIVVATPNYLHREMTVAALQAGKHVLCQKPPAMSTAEVVEMFDAAKAAGRTLMISLNQRFEYSNLWLKELIDQGELGEAYYGSAGWLRRRHQQPGWFTDKARSGGGPLIDLGVHVLDLALHFMGYPKVRSAKAITLNKLTTHLTVEDLAMAFIHFENGGAMTLESSLNLNVEREQVWCSVAGTKGGLQAYPPAFFTEKAGENINMSPVQAGYEPHVPEGVALMRHFIECLNTGRQTIVTREQMITLMSILDAIYRSGESGEEELTD